MKKKSIKQRELRAKYRKEKRCLICGKKPLYTKIFCKNCYNKHKEQCNRWKKKKIEQNLCIRCGKNEIYSGNLCKNCKEKVRISHNIWHWKGRIKILKAMGGKCIMCGTKDLRVLEIDHIQRIHHRKNGYIWLLTSHKLRVSEKARQDLLKEYRKGKVQLLCRNCQKLKEMNKSNIYYKEALKYLNRKNLSLDFEKLLEIEKNVGTIST